MKPNRLAFALAASLAGSASAQTVLDPVVVTPSRSEAPLSEALVATSVLDRNALDAMQSRTLIEAVSTLPGVGWARTGGEGQSTSLFIRGTEARHVAVFVDGVRIGSATLGLAALQDIPLAQVERIELVRGPLSALYGSDAIGGVLNIITRKGRGFDASVTYGSRDTVRGAAHLGLGSDTAWLALGVSGERTDGINACDPAAGMLFKACFTSEPDRDGYRNRGLNLAAGAKLGEATRLEARALATDARLEFDGFFQNQSKTRQQVLGASLNHAFGPIWTTKLAASRSEDRSQNFKNGVFASRFDTRMNQLGWENLIALPGGASLLAGVDHLDEGVSSTTNYTVKDRDTTSIFAQLRGALAGVEAQANLRHEDNSQFGTHTTGGLALRRAFSQTLAVRGSFGTGFKAPTFNDLYFPGFGNPNLRPEKSRSAELALEARSGGHALTLAAYHTRLDDLVIFSGGLTNNADARIRGIEAEWRWASGNWQVGANLTLQDPENRTAGANFGKQLPRRAQEMAHLDVRYQLSGWTLGALVSAQGRRFDNVANTDRMSGYAVVDLTAETRIARGWRLAVKVENATDRDYETAFLYNQPGRGLFVTLAYTMPK